MTTKTVGHTPGPWTLGRFGCVTGGAWLQYVNGQAQAQIASATVGDGVEPEEREANARLIAAAPELLEALERTQKYLDHKSINSAWTNEDRAVYAHNGAAIRKARSE